MPERLPPRSSGPGSRRVAPASTSHARSAPPDRTDRGTVIAVYGTRADVGVTTVAARLAVAFRSLDTNDVGLAELHGRASSGTPRSVGRAAARSSRKTDEERPSESDERVAIDGMDAALVRRADGVW